MKRFGIFFALFCALTLNVFADESGSGVVSGDEASHASTSGDSKVSDSIFTVSNGFKSVAALSGVTAVGAGMYAGYLKYHVLDEIEKEIAEVESFMTVRKFEESDLPEFRRKEYKRLKDQKEETEKEVNFWLTVAGSTAAGAVVIGGVAWVINRPSSAPVDAPAEVTPTVTAELAAEVVRKAELDLTADGFVDAAVAALFVEGANLADLAAGRNLPEALSEEQVALVITLAKELIAGSTAAAGTADADGDVEPGAGATGDGDEVETPDAPEVDADETAATETGAGED